MACTSGCATQDHESYAACLRAKAPAIQGCDSVNGNDTTREKKWVRECDRARSLMAQGIVPENTFGKALDKAERISDQTGVAYQAGA